MLCTVYFFSPTTTIDDFDIFTVEWLNIVVTVVSCYRRNSLFLFLSPDLTWINVRSAEEAWKILRAGHRNQSFASTQLNQNSSRR